MSIFVWLNGVLQKVGPNKLRLHTIYNAVLTSLPVAPHIEKISSS